MQRRHNQVVPKARSQKTQLMETIVMARCCTTLFMKTHAAQHMQRAQEFGLFAVCSGIVQKKQKSQHKNIPVWSIKFDEEEHPTDEKYWTLFETHAAAQKALLALRKKMNET